MSYRDSLETARARREQLLRSLDDARREAARAREHAARIESLERELESVDALLADAARARPPELLDKVRVASSCTADWDTMKGDDRVRFCGQCQKNVYNLSTMPRPEAEALLRVDNGELCARLFRRADGTILTSDCPVGVRRKRHRVALASAVGGAVVAAAGLGMASSVAHMGAIERPTTAASEPVRAGYAVGQIAPQRPVTPSKP